MMKRFIRQKNRNSKTMGVVLLIAVLCLSVVYAALYSVIYMYGTGSVDISYKDLYYWVDTSTGKGNFYTSCTNGTATSSTGITKMSVAVNALKEGGTIHMLSPYSATAEETVSVNSKTVKIQRYVQKGENNKVEHSNEKEPLFNVSANLKFDLVKVGTEAPCLTIDGSEITSDASAFNVLSGGTLTLNNDADGVAQGTFVVTGNYAKVSGGAVNLSGGSLVANAVQFTDNRSINTLESYGGAIYASGGSNVTLNNCSFENNTARSSTKINVEGTIYQKGEHPAYGGAVYSISSTVNMSGCTFTANAADVEGDNGVLASGGAVYIGSQSSGSMKDCTVTNNQTSYNGRTGAGVCVAVGGNNFAFSGKTIIENNHCYFLGADIDNGLNENDNLHLEGGEASNISVDTSKLSAGSKIYITASPSPSENSDFRSLISDKSHKASSTDYFLSDVGGYVVQSNADSNDGGLYLVAGSSYTDLWYGCKNIYQFDRYGKVDGNYFYYGFFGDEALTQDTGFTRLTDAVAALQTGGKIHMLKTYKVSVSETVNMPENKTVNVVRESSLGGNSMFKLQEGTFIINSLKDSSTIIFDGQGQNLSASTSGGAFSATRNTTNSGENNFELNGIQKSDGTKSIIIQNNKITGYNFGGGLYIWSDKSKISNCEIRNNSTEKTGGGIYFSNSMGSYVLENCNVTSNTASENGGGVYLDYGTYAMLGTTNITGNTVNGAANNLYVVNAVGLASGSSSLNTGSQIGLTTSSTPAEGSPVKFASSATEAMKACFTPDVSDYKVKYDSSDNGGLYLIVPIYSELWYKADENDSNTKKFFEGSDVNNLTATDITKFSKAVQCLRADGKIHMLTTYESTENETTTMTAGKNVTVLRDGTFNNASMFKITKGTFEIDATDESSSVTFDGQKIETTVDKGGAFYVGSDGSIKFSGAEKTVENKKEKTIVIKDNIISLSSDTSSVNAQGGGVYLGGSGTSTLTNCSITGNMISAAASSTKNAYAKGGGVYIYSGTNTLENCSITGNKASATSSSSADADGGGVHINYGTNTLENCSITENKAESSKYAYGGGVYIDGGTNTLTNCSITGNMASSSYANGGGVYIVSGTNTLTNCSITGNKVSASSAANARGGGVLIYENTTLLGTMNITGNMAIVGSDSSDNNLYLDGSSYTVALSDSNGNKLSAGSQIGVTTRTNPTSVTDQKFATNAIEDEMINYFTSDKGYMVCKQGTELYLTLAPSELYQSDNKFYLDAEKTKLTNIKTMAEAVKTATTVHMLSAYTASSNETVEVPSGKNVTVLRESTFTDNSMFKITGGTFEVSATDPTSSITFDGNNITPTAEYKGGAFNVYQGSATFKLSGAEKSDGVSKTIVIKNNIVTGTDCWGGGIYCRETTNVISNCNIINNSAEYGGGIYLDFGTNTISNCTITDNKSTNLGAGIACWEGTNLMTGSMKITGNKTSNGENSNVFFNSSTVSLADSSSNKQLSTSSQIGVTTSPEPAEADVQFATNATEEMKACFTHDPGTSEVVYKDGGLYLTVPIYSELWYKADENDSNTKKFFKGSDVNNLTATDITKFSKAVQSLSADGKIHMLTTYESTADETTTVPAGKNVTVLREGTFKDASMFSITGGTFTVNATDASSSVTFDGQKIETTVYRGGAFYVDGGSIKLSGAEKTVENEKVKTIVIKDNIISRSSDSDVSADGGGVYLGGSGTNTLSNCSITGNTVSCNSTTTSYASGGGVCIWDGTNTLTNCSITGNKAYASSDTKSAFAYGGGVHTAYGGKNTLSNCSITENTASSTSSASSHSPDSIDAYGGGVCIWNGTNTLTNCSITGNTASSSGSSCNAYGGGVFNYKNATLLGTTNITGNTVKKRSDSSDDNLHLMNKYTVALSNSSGGALSADSHIGVTSKASVPVQFATNATEEMKACFTADYSDYYVSYKDSGLYLNYVQKLYYKSKKFYTDEACTNATSYTKLSEAVNSIDSNGKIYMMSSYSSSSNETVDVTAGKNIRVIRHKDFKYNSMFSITGGTFKVNATDPTSAITFDGNNITTSINEGGAFYVSSSGSLKLSGADKSGGGKTITIKSNSISSSTDIYGGGVYLAGDGTNTLSNCSITGNTASTPTFEGTSYNCGGGICIIGSGTNTLTNCSITGNTLSSSVNYSSDRGGGVYLAGDGTNTLSNCSITGNTASTYSASAEGGGVCIYGGTNTLSNCSITGNTTSAPTSGFSDGGGFYIDGGANTLSNCSITGNTASGAYGSSVLGGGVHIYNGASTLLGTMNITDNTIKKGSTSSNDNLYVFDNRTVALSSGSKSLSTSSQIGVTTGASAPVKFATGVTDDIAAVRFCFDDDKKANEVYRIGTELYLGKDSSVTYEKYDNLYYYRTTTGDNNDGLFYTDSSHSNSTGIKLLSEAVGHLNKGGNIYFMSSYTTSTTGERVVAPPDMGEIHIIRYSSPSTTFDGESMININGLFEVTCPHTNSTIIFDGNNVSTKNTGAGILWLWQTGSARIIGASPSCKNIKFVNSIITTGGGAAIRLGGGDNVIKNCIIEGNKRTSTDSEGSGAVLLLEDGGHANSTSMENCDLINNTSAGNAGALYVASGTHSFTNCNITNNQGFGGGSYINGGTNSFTGCKISNNTSVKVGSIEPYGGGLYINKGTNYFLNCEINGNKAHNGGGLISKSATNTFEKCTVSGNVIDDYGNGLCLDGSSNTIIDCTITDNKGASHGAGIWVGGGTVNIYGNTVVKNNVLNDGTTENNLEVAGGCTVALSDGSGNALSTSSNIGVTTNTAPTVDTSVQFATSATEEMKACFTPDEAKRYVTYEDGKLYLRYGYVDLYYKNGTFYTDEACSSSSGLTKFSEAVSNIALKGGTIHMMSQYASSADETVTVLAGANITVARHKDFKDASMFKITGGTFKVNATDATSSITFDGNKIKTTVEKGGAFYVLGDSTKFTLNGAEKSGGGKTITIQNNAVITQGGGIYLNGNGTHTLTNCSITKNTASSSGGGIYLNSNGTCTLLGTMNITGNTAKVGSTTSSSNLYVASGETVVLSSGSKSLSTSSQIGVTTQTAPTSSTPVQFATGATSAMASCFTPDDSSYNVAYGSSGTLSLVVDNQKQITLSSSTPSIRITPEGYYTPQNSTTLNSFTGTYVLTGSYTGTSSSKNPDVVFENTSTERKTIKVKIKNLSLKAYSWCSLGLLKGNGPMDIYITAEGTNSLQGYNHPAFNTNGDKVQGSNMYLNVKSGSTLLGSTNKEAPSRVAADGINFYFNGTLLTSEQKNKNTKFTSTGYTQ